jgi:hypothetical protein
MSAYNGWSNYETWVVGMYLDGNYDGEGTYHAALDLVRESVEDGRYVADALKDWTREQVEAETNDLANGIAADLLGAALSEVDWHELAEHKVNEVNDQ